MDAMSAFRPQRAVSTRELTRRMAHVLDEIQETGFAVTVVRYGRAVAVLAPLDGGRIGPADRWRPSQPPLVDEIDIEDVDLTEDQREVMLEIMAEPLGEWSLNNILPGRTISHTAVMSSQLELEGIVERIAGRVRLTKKGLRLAATCADQVSVRSAAEREG